MYENENADRQRYFSEPDEGGVRYYQSPGNRNTYGNRSVKRHTLRNSLIVLSCIIVGVVLVGMACSSMFESGETIIKLPSTDYIATVYIEGTIARDNSDSWGAPQGYQHNWTLSEIDRLIYDYNNKGMILFVDSPGGGIYESDELYFKIKEYQEYTGRPVYVSMASMAASGGYYISAPADMIYANRNCWTGSIGVTLGTIIDVSAFLENYGIKTTTIDSGRNKSMGSYFDPLTPEQQWIFQAMIDEAYDQFVDIVAYERGIDVARVKEIADGRIYTAKQAQAIGLVDVVGTYGDALADMMEEYDLYHCTVFDVQYLYKSWLPSIFGNVSIGSQGDAAAILKMLDKQNRFPVSYMCEALVN